MANGCLNSNKLKLRYKRIKRLIIKLIKLIGDFKLEDINNIKKQMARPSTFPSWCNTGSSVNDVLRHHLNDEEEVVWDVSSDNRLPHYDHIEMSGFFTSGIISYGVQEDKSLILNRHILYPMLRTIPNDTRGNLSHNFPTEVSAEIYVDDIKIIKEYPAKISIKGYLDICSSTDHGILIDRKLFPSSNDSAFIEKITITNNSDNEKNISIKAPNYLFKTDIEDGVEGIYDIRCDLVGPEHYLLLCSDEQEVFYVIYTGSKEDERVIVNPVKEENIRKDLVDKLFDDLLIETPNEILNTAFNFMKLRASESIFKTKNGLMHAPGGGHYYAALWTNDQCEYVNPFYPFVGYETGNEQSINSYKLFMKHMDPEYRKPLISSIVAEGEGFWNGAGDRGDAAMFAYGAARFCLAYGNREVAEELWSGIEWSLEYTRRKINKYGVIESDSDELENRFESGSANLFTACLAYDAYQSAAMLGKELGKSMSLIDDYTENANQLEEAIEDYFGGNVEGFDTYKYYQGNEILRSWICMPLVVGLKSRVEGTVEALFSKRLWSKDGLSTQAGEETFWDRSTLYALRGVFSSGKADIALKYLKEYTEQRLLGEHVPYPVEAYPEGNQRHLSAESALYVRVFTEGVLGIRPIGFRSFECTPNLPEEWNEISLRRIKAFDSIFDIEVSKVSNQLNLKVIVNDDIIFDEVSDSFVVNL